MKILCVDDQENARLALSKMLSRDHTVVLCSSGKETIEVATKDPQLDLILLDCILPDIPGIEVAKKLVEAGCNTPIIMVTARNEPAHISDSLEAGAVDYVLKPIDPELLREAIADVAKRKKAG